VNDDYSKSRWGVRVNGMLICLGSGNTSTVIEDAMRARFLACEALRAAFVRGITVEIVRFSEDLSVCEVLAKDEL
jgi:hypothetical protein